ncbi:hypothetical protein Q8F55_000917 [Vanrija albida]|uniref:Uncharacterized protein n=1 Tax=Vanrija albida TaxID=181172 RepID=A0ABR3QEM1_9TREE
MASNPLAGAYERSKALNPSSLVGVAAIICWLADLSFEFTLMVFGLIALELPSPGPLSWFLTFVLIAAFYNLLALGSAAGVTFLLTVVLLVLKVPIFASSLVRLRDKGGELGIPGLDLFQQWQTASPARNGGGIIGTGPRPAAASAPPQAGAFSGGGYRLGGDDESQPPRPTHPGGYQPIS